MRRFFTFIILSGLILALPWWLITWTTKNMVYRDIDILPFHAVWLLLGTTPSANGMNNIFFSTRIEAAKTLYEKGKIRQILVSGDNSTSAYNEPEMMRKALLKAGIPECAITLDYAGFDTLDSVVRAKTIFGQEWGFTIISQPFHVERAIFLAHSRGIEAIGFGTVNIAFETGFRTYIREIGARWKAILETLLGTEAATLGKKEALRQCEE